MIRTNQNQNPLYEKRPPNPQEFEELMKQKTLEEEFTHAYYREGLSQVLLDDCEGIDKEYAERFKQHIMGNFDTYMTLKMNQKKKPTKQFPPQIQLANFDPTQKLLVFDLDETIIHTNTGASYQDSHKFVKVRRAKAKTLTVGFSIRPQTREMLSTLKEYYNIVLYTSSVDCYAKAIFKVLDPKQNIFLKLLTQRNCVNIGGKYVKDLGVFEDISLENIVLVDNFIYAFYLHPDNGIPILPFYSAEGDTEFASLQEFLIQLSQVQDVRKVIHRQFGNKSIEGISKIHGYIDNLRTNLEACSN